MSDTDPHPRGNSPSIVVFSRHFPPHVSGGARRPYYLVKALQSLGCRVFVVAPALPGDIEGIAVPHVQPDPALSAPGRRSLRDVLRDWVLWPDPDIRWTKRAVQAAHDALPFIPDWVMTTSPPESIHYAGAQLKKKYKCRWYADVRDHWLVQPFRKQRENGFRRLIEGKIARTMLRGCDLVSTVNAPIADEMRGYTRGRGQVFVLPHFAIDASVETLSLPDDQLNLVYTGSFSLSDPACKITDTLDVFAAALAKNPALHFHMAGRLSEVETARIHASPCQNNITVHGVVSLEESHALQRAADALILSGSPHAATPPGKAAEYAARGKPIIAISEAVWAADFNGGQSAVERLAQLGADTPPHNKTRLPTQTEAAQEILRHMAKGG